MGLIDSAFPLLDGLDDGLARGLPAWARLTLYGAASGLVSMLVYRLLSNQDGIREQKARQRELQLQLKAAQDDLALTMRLTRGSLGAAFRVLGMSLWPTLVASLPVVVMVAWLAMRWSQPMPEAGASVPLAHEPATAELAAKPPESLAQGVEGWVLRWPAPDRPVALTDASGSIYDGLGARPAASVLRKRAWWNLLLGSPAGYLAPDAQVEAVQLAIPTRQVLGAGPAWARGYELLYFAVVALVSLTIKFRFKIA